jgi:hypothetical protein
MKLTIRGEEVDYSDDKTLRSLSRSYAIDRIQPIKSKQIRGAFEAFYADLYYTWLKINAVVFFHEAKGDTQIDAGELKELVDILREILGQNKPSANITDEETDSDGRDDGDEVDHHFRETDGEERAIARLDGFASGVAGQRALGQPDERAPEAGAPGARE